MYCRTSQVLELFDEAPDDGANWGNIISTLTKYEDSDSSDDDGPKNSFPGKSISSRLNNKQMNSTGALSMDTHNPVQGNVAGNAKKCSKQGKVQNKV